MRKKNLEPAVRPGTAKTYRGFKLNPFQAAAVEAIDANRSVLVSAPTGAGKTLIAEYAIEKVLSEGGQAI
ncbi:MAG: DEAD/DEAH box helicase, partial [Planctomycetes bacterium]|nr:DEAD/DEAH box helicase [Planctomycetota bacterium]